MILECRILCLIQIICWPHLAQACPINQRMICDRPFSHPLWLGVYIFVQIQFQYGWRNSFVVLLDIKLHMSWLWQCDWHLLWICYELGTDVAVVQHKLIFQWYLQWNHCSWCGTVFLMGHGFVVWLVPPLYFAGFDFTPSELVWSIVTPSEIDYLAVTVEYMVIVLHIWKFLIAFWWQLVQVIQVLMVMTVLGFQGHILIVMLQLLLHMLMMFWACKNGEERSQPCLKFSRLWCL